MKRFLLLVFFVMLSLVQQQCSAQNFGNSEYFLIDSLDLTKLSESEKQLLDSCLAVFHSKQHDTIRIGALSHFVEECLDDALWPRYNRWLSTYLEEIIDRRSYDSQTSNRLKSLWALSISNIGYYYQSQGDIPKALEYYSRSLKIQEEIGDKEGIATSLNNIGLIYDNQGDIPKALEYYSRSLKIYEEIGDKDGIATSLNNIGVVYEKQGDIPKALEYYSRSLKIREEIGDKYGIAISLNNIGSIYYDQGDIPKALEYYSRSLKSYEEIGDKYGIAMSLNNIGYYYKSQGDIPKALEYYSRSLKIREEIGDKEGIAISLGSIGRVHFKQMDYQRAEAYLKRSMELSRELGYPEEISSAAEDLSELYRATGKHELALENYELYIQMRDSINNTETQKTITKYEYEKRELVAQAEQEKKDAIAIEQLRRKNQQRNAFIGGFVLMLGLAGVSFRSYRIKKRDNGIITAQKEVVEKKNHEILESINYAKKLQTAVLPPAKVVREFFANSFLLYLPRDIVSGDFYWMENKGDTSYFAVADCTGHGVPGAMLSIIGLNGLNRALNEKQLKQPKDILTSLSETVNRHFEKSDATVRDGMDICLCALDNKTKKLTFSGANNPLWIARDNEMLILKGDRRAIGHDDLKQEFTQQEIQLQNGDTVYLASDGYQDQLGGKKYLKMMTKVFRTRLLALSTKPMEEQRSTLISDLDAWKGKHGQTDDVCIMGIRV